MKELLHYDPETGVFVWREWRGGTAFAGTEAGRLARGYVGISVDKRRYPAHRLAWLYVTGEWPPQEIDHINGHRADNRWSNLRLADRSVNNQNRRAAHCHSKTGVLGVTMEAGRYRAAITVGGKTRHIGSYSSADLAHAAYLSAKRELHPGCTL